MLYFIVIEKKLSLMYGEWIVYSEVWYVKDVIETWNKSRSIIGGDEQNWPSDSLLHALPNTCH